MSWLLDRVPDDDFDERPPEEAPAERPAVPMPTVRSTADDILDAVSGHKRAATTVRDLRMCPLCGSATKVRSGSVGATTITRRCTNGACKNEYSVASVRSRTYMPPVPPDPLLAGGPYVNGPSRGGGGSAPPMSSNEPVHRRLSEFIRRVNHDGE